MSRLKQPKQKIVVRTAPKKNKFAVENVEKAARNKHKLLKSIK